MFFQTADKHPPSEGNDSDMARVGTDDGSIGAAEESVGHSSDDNDGDTDADDDDDDEFVDAGDEVEDIVDLAPWVTERRHSGDGEVQLLPIHSYFRYHLRNDL